MSFRCGFDRVVFIIFVVLLAACSPQQPSSPENLIVVTASLTPQTGAVFPTETPGYPVDPTLLPTFPVTMPAEVLATVVPTDTLTPVPSETPAPTETAVPQSYEDRIQERFDAGERFVCLPEFCGGGVLTLNQEEARKQTYDFFYSLMDWLPNRQVYEDYGLQLYVSQSDGSTRLITRDEFETAILNKGEIVPTGLAYPGGINYRDGVAYPVNDIGYYSMDQTTQEPIFLGGGIYELPDYEQLSAMRNDPESGEKYSFVRVFSVSGTAAIHFGMADPVSVENSSGDSVNIARFILGAGVQGTPVDVHPVSGKDPEKWKRNARGYNSVFALYRTMAGFAQHVKDRWGEESQYASQAWNDLGTNLKGRIEGTRDLFVPVEE